MAENSKTPMFVFLILVLTFVLYLGNTWGVFAEEKKGTNYTDIKPGAWFEEAVSELTSAKVLNGYPDGTFQPNELVTFGEFISIMVLANAYQKTSADQRATSSSGFSSEADNWAAEAYHQGLAQGLYTKWEIESDDLAKAIPRKYMALIIGSVIGDRTISDYAGLLESVQDIKPGDPFEFEMMKAYDAGILNGYPDGRFAPNGSLTRAEAAMAVYQLFAIDPGYQAMETWYNGNNVSLHDDNIYWLENKQFKPQVRGQFHLKERKLYFIDESMANAGEWSLAGTTYKTINEDIYKVLKAYWKWAAKEGYFIAISGGRGLAYDAVSIVLVEKDGPNFPHTASFSFNDGKAPLAGKVQPFVIFNLGMNYRLWQFEQIASQPDSLAAPPTSLTSVKTNQTGAGDWRDAFLSQGRVLDEGLALLNKNLLIEIFGQSAGSQINDFALGKYKKQYVESQQGGFLKLVPLANDGKIFDGVSVYFDDDATSRTTIYIGQH